MTGSPTSKWPGLSPTAVSWDFLHLEIFALTNNKQTRYIESITIRARRAKVSSYPKEMTWSSWEVPLMLNLCLQLPSINNRPLALATKPSYKPTTRELVTKDSIELIKFNIPTTLPTTLLISTGFQLQGLPPSCSTNFSSKSYRGSI